MKKENRISLVTMLIGFLIFYDFKPYSKSNCKSCFIINWNFCYCRKHSIREKSKESEKLWDFASYKVNNPKVKEHQAKEVINARISKKIERRPALLIILFFIRVYLLISFNAVSIFTAGTFELLKSLRFSVTI